MTDSRIETPTTHNDLSALPQPSSPSASLDTSLQHASAYCTSPHYTVAPIETSIVLPNTQKISSYSQISEDAEKFEDCEDTHKSTKMRLKQFVRLEPLRSLSVVRTQQMGEEFVCAFLSANQAKDGENSMTKREFARICTLAEEHEEKQTPRKRSKKSEDRKPPIVFRFEIMTHEDFPSEQFLPMYSEILTMLEAVNLPFALFRRTKGHGTYAVAYIIARPYYPEGIYKETIANHDYYVDAKKVCCTADTPGAVVRWHKGDIISRKIITFGNKTQKLSGTSGFFNRLIKRVKYSVRTFLKNLGTPLKWGFYFHKLPQRDFRNYKKKMCASIWNRTFCYMEFYLNRFMEYATECGVDAKKEVEKIYNNYNVKIQDFLKNRKFYTNRSNSPSFSVRLKRGYPKRTCYFLINSHRISDTTEYCAVLLYALVLDLRQLSRKLLEGDLPEEHLTKEEESRDFGRWFDVVNNKELLAYIPQ